MKTLTLTTIIGLAIFILSLPISADEMPSGPYLSTIGTASVDATPDIATITIEVSFLAKDAAAAKRQVDKRVTQYYDFLLKNGVEKKDINAANLSTQPEYDYQKNAENKLIGYRAVRQVQVIVRQLSKLNGLLDEALKLGLNEIHAIKLSIENPKSYHDQVRKKAVDNAIFLASSLAEGFKVKLGSVYSIHYQGDNEQTMPISARFLRAENATTSNPAQTYEQQMVHFKDQVDVVFELQNDVASATK